MRRLTSLSLLLILSVGLLHATGSIDTLSYAFGHQHTLATLAGNNSLMQTGSDFEDYIRGLEENLRDLNHMGDSSYMLSYALGGLEATFIYSGASRAKEEDRPPFPCIIAGLRKVGNNEISLPADTIAAMNTINSLTTENRHQSELDKENACRFFTAYGIMKAFQPGLQQYINEIKPGTKCIANRQAFANGMADVLESATEIPKTAHDIGKIIALSAKLAEIDDSTFDYNSFIAGAKAALGLSDEIIPREAVEQIIDIKYAKYDDTANDADLEKAYSLLGKLEIEPFTEYSVDWSVTAGPVAGIGTPATDSFFMIMNQLGINENPVNGTLMIHTPDENGSLFDAISSAIRNSPLPDGYKWFCGKTDNNETTVGIMDSSHPFTATVQEAMVDFNPTDGQVSVPWTFEPADAIRWATMTGNNVGNHIAMEINGKFIFAPMVCQRISGGGCSFSGVTAEEINRLFKNAVKIVKETPVDYPHDTIEVIEIN